MLSYNRNLREHAKALRKNMPLAERILWSRVKGKQLKGCQFYRQKIIGNYIVDFYCAKGNLVIEVDGGQHYSSEEKQKDRIRDEYMAQVGLRVLRFSNREVLKNVDEVIEMIWRYL